MSRLLAAIALAVAAFSSAQAQEHPKTLNAWAGCELSLELKVIIDSIEAGDRQTYNEIMTDPDTPCVDIRLTGGSVQRFNVIRPMKQFYDPRGTCLQLYLVQFGTYQFATWALCPVVSKPKGDPA